MFPFFFFLMVRRPPRSTLDRSSAASDVYKRQDRDLALMGQLFVRQVEVGLHERAEVGFDGGLVLGLSLIHISEPTRPY